MFQQAFPSLAWHLWVRSDWKRLSWKNTLAYFSHHRWRRKKFNKIDTRTMSSFEKKTFIIFASVFRKNQSQRWVDPVKATKFELGSTSARSRKCHLSNIVSVPSSAWKQQKNINKGQRWKLKTWLERELRPLDFCTPRNDLSYGARQPVLTRYRQKQLWYEL